MRSPRSSTTCRSDAGAAGAARGRREGRGDARRARCRRLHYLSVPPSAALSVVRMLGEANLVDRARIIMEKPFGTDLASAVALNANLHEVFPEERIFRIDHFLGKEPAQNILAFRFANGLFEPIWNRNFIDHVQIDVPETLGLDGRAGVLRADRRLPRHGRHAPVPDPRLHGDGGADRAGAVLDQRGEEQGLPQPAADRARSMSCAGSTLGYRDEPGVDPESETETFIALKCRIDNWRWAGVPFYLRTGKKLAEGQRIISIAFREPPKSMFPAGSGVGAQGPDHLTFDLADAAKMSLSFYGKRPGPGHAAGQAEPAVRDGRHRPRQRRARGVRAADPRRDARRPHAVQHRRRHRAAVGGVGAADREPAARTQLRTGVVGPERDPPAVAPHAWRLPFERVWRDPDASDRQLSSRELARFANSRYVT